MRSNFPMLCIICCLFQSSTPAPVPNPPDSQATLDLHNWQRMLFGVPNLTWSTSLAQQAQAKTDACFYNTVLGEWAAFATYPSAIHEAYSFTAITDAKGDWDCATDTCTYCGYRQVIFESTTSVGCGRTSCDTNSPSTLPYWDFILCSYSPIAYSNLKPFTVYPEQCRVISLNSNATYSSLTVRSEQQLVVNSSQIKINGNLDIIGEIAVEGIDSNFRVSGCVNFQNGSELYVSGNTIAALQNEENSMHQLMNASCINGNFTTINATVPEKTYDICRFLTNSFDLNVDYSQNVVAMSLRQTTHDSHCFAYIASGGAALLVTIAIIIGGLLCRKSREDTEDNLYVLA